MMYAEAYTKCLRAEPFPGRVDPWAEVGYYFQQIHPIIRSIRMIGTA